MIDTSDVEKELYSPEEKVRFIRNTASAMLSSQKMSVRFMRRGATVEISCEEENTNDFWILTKKGTTIQNFHFFGKNSNYAIVNTVKQDGRYEKLISVYMGEEALDKTIDILNQSDVSNH